MRVTSLILAAGHGTRMKSDLPKVLHSLAGKPLVLHALDSAAQVSPEKPAVIIGHGADAVRQTVGDRARCVVQEPQLGTGHAVQQAEALLKGQTDLVLVVTADMPLLTAESLRTVVQTQIDNPGPITMATILADDPRGFGRVVRGSKGEVLAIVEEAQATAEQRAIKELNASVYCFRSDWLWDALRRVQLSPKGEYYLTDTVEIAVRDGLEVRAVVLTDAQEALGINTRVHLAEAETVLRARINRTWMLAGVTLVDPSATYIEPGVTIGADTIIHPNTTLRGNTTIGRGCVIGPNVVIESSLVEDGAQVKPFVHLLPGSTVKQ